MASELLISLMFSCLQSLTFFYLKEIKRGEASNFVHILLFFIDFIGLDNQFFT